MKRIVVQCVLTGAPGGGKSSTLAILRKAFAPFFHVIIVNETATEFFNSNGVGGTPLDLGTLGSIELHWVQAQLLSLQLRAEVTARDLAADCANDGRNVLIFYDRAVPDGGCFADPACWAELSKTEPVDPAIYDMVLELRSAALLDDRSAYEYGPNCPNAARQHDREAAIAFGEKFREVYDGHTWFRRIEAEPSRWVKFKNVVAAVVEGLPDDMRASLGSLNLSSSEIAADLCDFASRALG
jgi:hypothetical protein